MLKLYLITLIKMTFSTRIASFSFGRFGISSKPSSKASSNLSSIKPLNSLSLLIRLLFYIHGSAYLANSSYWKSTIFLSVSLVIFFLFFQVNWIFIEIKLKKVQRTVYLRFENRGCLESISMNIYTYL